VGALDELPRLLKLGPPPQVGADLVEQAGDGLRVTTEAAGMVGDDQGMGNDESAADGGSATLWPARLEVEVRGLEPGLPPCEG
jgi:hypothetical protein